MVTLRHGKGKGSPTAAYPQVTEPVLTLRPCGRGVSSRSGRAATGSADAQAVRPRGQLTLRPCGRGISSRSVRAATGSAHSQAVQPRGQLTLRLCGRGVSSRSGRGDTEPAYSQRVPGLVHSVSFRVTSQLSLLCMYHC